MVEVSLRLPIWNHPLATGQIPESGPSAMYYGTATSPELTITMLDHKLWNELYFYRLRLCVEMGIYNHHGLLRMCPNQRSAWWESRNEPCMM
ncbi:hypothetical protein P152DRAFT_185006 [Eremomyces bilateralis CBS 781.70]|uniref:Uncharacterized protein n=1 Tax=Eremomyces bilateralis CBS 781.70 TaxID=1392243 RepID=A0A6G1GBI5_9PEZI|nr:uncharacterized protein P152DRAFT_185006 [Eremomyces bilateralis CBS 781.70]KAF1815413.1 hypothetical protein P152DRAFT_185006 [Eremomyces bilateralis CBS 781.70]